MANYLICNSQEKIYFDKNLAKSNLSKDVQLLLNLSNNYPEHNFYIFQNTDNYPQLDNYFNKLFKNKNVIFYTDRLINKKYPELSIKLTDENSRMLNNLKKLIDETNKIANKIEGIICLGNLDDSSKYEFEQLDNFYSRRFIEDNTDIPLISINYNNQKIKPTQINSAKIPDKILGFEDKIFKIKVPKYQYPGKNVSKQLIQREVEQIKVFNINDEIDFMDYKLADKIINTINEVRSNSNLINLVPFRNKIRTVVLDGPKLSGKDTFIKKDILDHGYKTDKYIICHSNPQATNDYKYFSDQFDLIFDKETRFDYLPKGMSLDNIQFEKIKVIYHSRNFLSEFIYGSIEFNIMLGLFRTSEYPLGSININKLRYARIDISDVKELAKKNIELIICYFKHDKYLDDVIKLGQKNRPKERLIEYEQEVLKQSNYAFKTMNRLFSTENLNNKFKMISWKKTNTANFKENKISWDGNKQNKFTKPVSF